MHRHRFPQMRRRPSHVRCVYITQYALARSLARHCQPDSNCLHAQQNPRVLSHHTHSIAAECALAGATMHIIHSVSRIYTDRRRMTFTFLLRWPLSCLNPILMRTDDVVDVDKCDALVLAICWLLQHNFHDCPNYNLSVTHDDYSDLPSQHLSRFVYERQPSVSIIHVGQLSQSDIYSKLKLCALNCNKYIIENGDEWIKKKKPDGKPDGNWSSMITWNSCLWYDSLYKWKVVLSVCLVHLNCFVNWINVSNISVLWSH